MTMASCEFRKEKNAKAKFSLAVFERRPATLIFTVSLCALLFNIPRHFESFLDECYDLQLGRRIAYVQPTELRQDPTYIFIYKLIFTTSLVTIGPFLGIFICLMIIMRTVLRHNNSQAVM